MPLFRLCRPNALLVAAALSVSACASATLEPPPGCIVNAENAADLAEVYLTQLGLDWGDPIQYSFDESGGRWRLVYETSEGEPTRSLIVSCTTGVVIPG